MREFLTNEQAAYLHLGKHMTQKAIGELYDVSASCVFQKIKKFLRAREVAMIKESHKSAIAHKQQMLMIGNIQACAMSIASSEIVKSNH